MSADQLHTEGSAYEPTPEGLKAALAALGGTAREIAASLAAKGIKGTREEPNCCPVANYLSPLFVGWEPSVQGDEIHIGRNSEENGVVDVEVSVAPIGEFVSKFDDEEYPELDDAPVEDEDYDDHSVED